MLSVVIPPDLVTESVLLACLKVIGKWNIKWNKQWNLSHFHWCISTVKKKKTHDILFILVFSYPCVYCFYCIFQSFPPWSHTIRRSCHRSSWGLSSIYTACFSFAVKIWNFWVGSGPEWGDKKWFTYAEIGVGWLALCLRDWFA